ncbi:MAG: hypothetical protein ACO4CG_09600 [Prochlorothrix sp.]|nr:hypothetical protein [Prochlorothrix sp.]
MLREATTTCTEDGSIRRWFYDSSFDLIVWFTPTEEQIHGFELCYSPPAATEVAVRWNEDTGFAHLAAIEETTSINHVKTTVFDQVDRSQAAQHQVLDEEALSQFQVASLTLNPIIRDFILNKLETLDLDEA